MRSFKLLSLMAIMCLYASSICLAGVPVEKGKPATIPPSNPSQEKMNEHAIANKALVDQFVSSHDKIKDTFKEEMKAATTADGRKAAVQKKNEALKAAIEVKKAGREHPSEE